MEQEATFADVSKACGLEEQKLRRVLRHAMTKPYFLESRKGVVEHRAASKLLAQNEAVADWVDVSLVEMWPAATQVCIYFDIIYGRLMRHNRLLMSCGSGLDFKVQHIVYLP